MKKRILIVDDNKPLAKTLAKYLTNIGGYLVKIETDATKAFKVSKRFKPDLILLDIMMPGKDGFSVLSEMKDCFPLSQIPVVIMTGLQSCDARATAIRLCSEDFISKPFGMEQLVEKIHHVFVRQYGSVH